MGLKENVIIGKLIPAGTGFDLHNRPVTEPADLLEDEEDDVEEFDFSIPLMIDDNTDPAILEALATAKEKQLAALPAEEEFEMEYEYGIEEDDLEGFGEEE
jgi:DNA-directed RNA polymerase subunit beta'